MTESTNNPLFGLFQPQSQLKNLYYGPSCVQNYLLKCLPKPESKVYIMTGSSIATKTPVVEQLVELLGERHGGTCSNVKQHGSINEINQALEEVLADGLIDTVLSVGGGSPIDSAKMISYLVNERKGYFLRHISIPTTLSAAECTPGGGYTQVNGTKVGFMNVGMGIHTILYDPTITQYTPVRLWLASGIRAVDHAVETFYHPYATEMPWKALASWGLWTLFRELPKSKESHPLEHDVITKLQLAAYATSGFRGANFRGGMGLSHALGHALGSPYGIPHGETSCITLAAVVKLKALQQKSNAEQIARLLPAAEGGNSGDDLEDALEVGRRVAGLVEKLGLGGARLSDYGVTSDQIPLIVARASGGLKEGPVFDSIKLLVEGFM